MNSGKFKIILNVWKFQGLYHSISSSSYVICHNEEIIIGNSDINCLHRDVKEFGNACKFLWILNIPLRADSRNCFFSTEKAHFSSIPLE